MRRICSLASLGSSMAACGTLLMAAWGCAHPPGPTSETGDPCSEDMPCGNGLSCVSEERFPGGYCTAICAGTCAGEADCDASMSPSLCLARCAAASDCRDGYQCWRGNCRPRCRADAECGGADARCRGDGTCEGAECATDAECGASQICRAGACVEAPPDAGSVGIPPGTPCASASDCSSGVCLPPELGGVCSLACVDADDCFVFTTAAGCSAVPHDDDGDGTPDRAPSICVPSLPGADGVASPCTSEGDCVARLCQDGQCSEVCNGDEDCPPGMRCTSLARDGVPGVSYMGCGYDRISGITIESVDYGSFDIRAGFVERLRLATPPDAVSITLQADQRNGPVRSISFLSVVDPASVQIFDVTQLVMLVDQPIRWIPVDTGESVTMLIPNTTPDRVTFVSGLYDWRVGPIPDGMPDPAMPELHLSALIKRAPGGVVAGGQIELNVFLCGLRGGPTAATAAGDTRLQGSLARLEAILAPTGIRLGSVRYYDITDPAFRVIDSTDGPTSELADLFRQSRGRSNNALNVFFVRSISSGGGGFRALGIAGGIPGPIGIHGSYHSGVAVSFDSSVVGTGTTGSDIIGHILAHEVGHYIGLFHSTERARPCGPGEMPVPDGCSAFGGGDQLTDTSHGDRGNLMYWSIVGGGTNIALTGGQGFVFRMSALAGP